MDMKKNKWMAVFLGLAMPGLGQIYNGELIKGISGFIITLALFVLGFRWTVLLPDALFLFGVLITLLVSVSLYLAAAVHAFRQASNDRPDRQPAACHQWYFYFAVWLLGSILVSGIVYDYVRNNLVEAFVIPTSSMEPAVLKGDRLLADKTAYRRMAPQKGDVLIFVAPDDRSKKFIKRVEALPGDVVTLADRETQRVPHGFVYVLGDNREHSLDSRNFGFIPLRDVVAKVRQVYYSSGDEGIRWSRIGLHNFSSGR
jgi:signal peptidase I